MTMVGPTDTVFRILGGRICLGVENVIGGVLFVWSVSEYIIQLNVSEHYDTTAIRSSLIQLMSMSNKYIEITRKHHIFSMDSIYFSILFWPNGGLLY